MIRPLSRDETRKLLLEGKIGRLGCVEFGVPYVVPVSYVLHDDSIYIHSFIGRKIRAMRENPKTCLQVDEIIDDYHWRSAIAFGQYQEVANEQERSWAVRKLLSRFPHLTPVESVPPHDGQSSVIVFRIRIEEMSGMAEG